MILKIFLLIAVAMNFISAIANVAQMEGRSSSTTDFGAVRVAPVELTDAERTYFWVDVEVPAMDVELRTLSPERWAEVRKVLEAPLLLGYASPPQEERPCRIVVPAGWRLRAYPKLGRAEWADLRNAETLAHELIHCIRGRWHPE